MFFWFYCGCLVLIGYRQEIISISLSPDALPLYIISSLFWNDVQIFRAQMDNFISTTSGCFAIRRKYQKDQLGLFMIEPRWKVLTLWHTTEFFHKYFIKNSALIVWKIAINSCESLSSELGTGILRCEFYEAHFWPFFWCAWRRRSLC